MSQLADASLTDAGILEQGVDTFDPRCLDDTWEPLACAPGIGETHDPQGAQHIPEGTAITYELLPPSSGNHRGAWAKWGEYTALPPQRWLHNLEHGGVAFLYHPCAPAEMVDELRALIEARPADFRWVLTPYADLPSAVAVVAWEWRYLAHCVQPAEIDAFLLQHYRQAPEDIGADGSYSVGWLGR